MRLKEGDVFKVVLEYSPKENRVMVRGIFKDGRPPDLLDRANSRNVVSCFLDIDMGANIGFQMGDK